MATAAGTVIAGGVAQSGATVDLWLASRFSGTPAYNAAPPAGSPDAGPVTSGTTYGGQGAWQITGVADGSFYVRVVYSGNTTWGGPYTFDDDTDLVHRAGTETLTGLKTFSGGLTVSGGSLSLPSASVPVAALTGVLGVTQGGTGSATQNWVDLTSAQTVAGVKTFSAVPVFTAGLTVGPGGVITVPNGSIPYAAVTGLSGGSAGVDLGSSQTITGQKTHDNDLPIVGGQLLGTALATPAAPVVTPSGTTGSTTAQYQVVATSYDGRDGIPSATGQTTTGNATLTSVNFNGLAWPAVTGAASYKVLKSVTGIFKLLASGITATTYSDNGTGTSLTYTPATVNPGGEISGTAGTLSGALAVAGAVTAVGPVGAAGASLGGIVAGRYLGTVPVGGPTAGTWAVGDFGVDSAGRRWACTAAGAPGTWKTNDAGTWRMRAYLSAAQTTASGANTTTLIALDTDTGAGYDDSNSFAPTTHLFTVPTFGTGKWRCRFAAGWALANAPQDVFALVQLAGAEVTRGTRAMLRSGTAGDFYSSAGGDTFAATAGQTIGLALFSLGSNGLTITNAATVTFMMLEFQGS